MTFWGWLGNNSSQIQALAGAVAVFVGIAVGWVAWKQKGAAEAQAAAALRQTTAAELQADAARQQVAAARQQTETSLLIADRQVFPHISFTATTNRGHIDILNNGNGSALDVELNYINGNLGDDLLRIAGKTLVVGDSVTVRIDEGQAANPGLRLTYETVFGTKYVLEFQWNGQISQAVNQKLSVQS
ncbi:MAG TPA: hypothetical protein VK608_12955 [Edaphobacter sp.]|nr:hypothetical protein [Edaphobacter sp.]